MSTFGKVVAYALITLFLGVLLRELGFRGSRLVSILGTVSVIGAAVVSLDSILSLVPQLDGASEYTVAMLKIIGVGYACGVCADVCSELGEGSLAGAVSLFGRAEIVVISLPFITRIVEKGIELM